MYSRQRYRALRRSGNPLKRAAILLVLLAAPVHAAELPFDVGTKVAGFQDDFRGTTLAPGWEPTGTSLDVYSVADGLLQVRSATGDPNHLLWTGGNYAPSKQEVLARIRFRDFGSGDPARGGIAAAVDPTSSHGLNFHFRDYDQGGLTGRHLSLLDDFRAWGPGIATHWTDNTWYWVRLRHEPEAAGEGGSDVFARVWPANGATPEPAEWLVWDYVPGQSERTGFAGIAAGGSAAVSEFEVDYILIKAAGLPEIVVAPDAFPLAEVGATIVAQPVDQTVTELQPARFEVVTDGNPPPARQWYRGTNPITGATNAVYELPAANLADHLATFHVVVSNIASNTLHTVRSSNAVLRVTADATGPTLLHAQSLDLNQVLAVFSERLDPASISPLTHYTLSSTGAVVQVLQAVPDATGTNVLLSVSPLIEGTAYTLSVQNITDLAAARNPVAPGSQVAFTAISYLRQDIGSDPFEGVLTPVAQGFDMQAAGSGLIGSSDSCFFASQPHTGDFDVRVRLAGFEPGDIWAQAGLMARESTSTGAPFAAVFATPSNVGAGFLARTNQDGRADPLGLFPVNDPHTWLRLKRTANAFTGFASIDGTHWMELGSASVPVATTLQFGFVLASHRPGLPAHAQFRDYGPVTAPATLAGPLQREVPGQASRLTPFALTEIMFHPAEPGDSNLEFVEIFNAFGTPEDLGGYRLTGDINYLFPTNTVLQPGSYRVVARNPPALAAHSGITNILGPYSGALSDNGGTLRLRHRTGAIFLEVTYDTRPPWPRAADGAGHSLVLARPSLGQGIPEAWAASSLVGGSPGRADSLLPEPLDTLRINEFLAHTDDPVRDFVELYNHSNNPLDISGCWISDNRTALLSGATTNTFRVPDDTRLEARSFIVFDQDVLGFSLDAAGETLYLMNPSRTRILDAVRFAGQANGVSSGRYPDAAADLSTLTTPTPGRTNSPILLPSVVINEILFHPASRDSTQEFVELHNRTPSSVDVSGWRFTAGINFTLPTPTSIPAGGFLVVAADRTNLLARYPGVLNAANTVGNFSGSLDNNGERLTLSKPESLLATNAQQVVTTNLAWITVSEVDYRDGGRWSVWSDAGGSSLELVDPDSDPRRAANWDSSDETAKAPWTYIDYTNRVELGETSANQLQVLPLGAGQYLIDDVQVLNASGVNQIANSSFSSGATGWTAQGTLSASTYDSTRGYGSGGCYHVLAIDRGDNQVNRVRTPLNTALAPGTTATLRARIRWLRGHPEIILRIRGRWLETLAQLQLPTNPGTPGQTNSRRRLNAGPAIFNVSHFPVVPAAHQPVRVTAQTHDPDDIQTVHLLFRLDPASTTSTLSMTDDGLGGDEVAGDGVHSATLPGQPSGTLVAFRIEAADGAGPAATSVFPADAPARECLVRWGDLVKPGSIPAYRLWMTKAVHDTWASRNKLDNTPNDVTFVHGNQRAIYNARASFAGSPYIAPGFTTPSGNRCGYSIEFPPDDPFLGSTDLVLDWPGGHGGERTAVQEQMAYWVADQMDLPFSLRHYIRLSVNGVTDMQRGGVFEAIIQPARDFIRAWSPGDADGDFYKIDRAFEFSDSGSLIADTMPTLQVFNGADGSKKQARYRWNWLRRSYDSADNFTNLFAWVDALNAPAPEPYTSQTLAVMNVEQCMSIFAFEHIVVNFDSWGHEIGKNMYAYKPQNSGWQLYAFDLDWLMLVSAGRGASYGPSAASLFASQDPTVTRLYNHPPFRRAYLRAVESAANGPFLDTQCNPVMQAKHRWLVDEGVTLCDGSTLTPPTVVEQWFANRRAFLLSQLDSVAASFQVNGPTLLTTTNNPITFTGTAPLPVAGLRVNGVNLNPGWTAITSWSMHVPLTAPGTNVLFFEGLDTNGDPIPGANAQVIVLYTGPASPVWALKVRFNEWMADNKAALLDPADGLAQDWFELFNPGPGDADLSGFHLTDDLSTWSKWVIPAGTVIPAGSFRLVWADSQPEQNGPANHDLHADFQLSKDGETLALFAPDGTLVDSAAFGEQAEDIAQGRYPDAGALAGFLTRPTPRDHNAPPYHFDPDGPYIEPAVFVVSETEVTLGWIATVDASYQVEYSDSLGEPVWLPLGPVRTATSPVLNVRALLSDTTQRFFRLVEHPAQ